VAPVFHRGAFALALVAALGAPLLVAFLAPALSDRAGLGGSGLRLAALGGALWAASFGALAAACGRRIAFYEIGAASALLLVLLLGPGLTRGPALAGLPLGACEQQGRLVLVLGLLLVAAGVSTAAFVGSSLGFLLWGSGRLDASLSYEVFVARAHLRLSPRTLLALFAMVVTGLLPGLLAALAWSFLRDRRERAAGLRREPFWRPRMPATLLMTLISIGGVAIGVWALTVVLSVMSGFEGDLKAKILGNKSHGVVLKYGDNDFTEWRPIRDRTLGVPGVVGATPFVYSEVMVAAGQQFSGALVEGIDPATVGTVLDLPRNLEEGKLEWLLHPERIAAGAPAAGGGPLPGVVLGRELARQLRVFVGDVVSVVSPFGDLGPGGPQPRSRAFRVAGVFYCGFYEYDAKLAYVHLAEAQKLLGTGESVTGLELRFGDPDAARPIARRLGAALAYPYRVKDWGQLNRNLFSALMMEKVVMAIILAFIVLVASFIIVATLVMQVLDKRREIAVLKSMGAGMPSVMKIFVVEGLAIGAIGTAFGLLLGLGTCLFIDKVGIPLDPEVYYIANLPVKMDAGEFAGVAVLAFALAYLATLYPASKAARLEPVEGLRSE
jgi:lipoprotein-releasing system permease protein